MPSFSIFWPKKYYIPGTLLQGLAIVQPLHLHGRVRDGDDPALEVGPLALLDLDVLHGGREHWGLSGLLLFKVLLRSEALLLLLQVLELAHVTLRLCHHLCATWGDKETIRIFDKK